MFAESDIVCDGLLFDFLMVNTLPNHVFLNEFADYQDLVVQADLKVFLLFRVQKKFTNFEIIFNPYSQDIVKMAV